MHEYWAKALEWIELHPVFFMVVAWPILTAIVNWVFRARTDAELAQMNPRLAAALRFVRASGLDATAASGFLWKVLTGGKRPLPEAPPPNDKTPTEDSRKKEGSS
jgi:hypothetical protein